VAPHAESWYLPTSLSPLLAPKSRRRPTAVSMPRRKILACSITQPSCSLNVATAPASSNTTLRPSACQKAPPTSPRSEHAAGGCGITELGATCSGVDRSPMRIPGRPLPPHRATPPRRSTSVAHFKRRTCTQTCPHAVTTYSAKESPPARFGSETPKAPVSPSLLDSKRTGLRRREA
jgi:hypothetical protein